MKTIARQRTDGREWAEPETAWAPYVPDKQRPWDRKRVGHLFRRAAFGATREQVERALRDGPARTIDRLLRPGIEAADYETATLAFEDTAIDPGSTGVETLQEWWLRRMIQSPDPLREKLTVCWHGHFGVSNQRVQSGLLMVEHTRALRKHALGTFPALLDSVLADPAVWIGHDAERNPRGQPNTSFARTCLEPFALGPRMATDADVLAAARALSGNFVLRNQLRFLPTEHDDGPKTLLGQEGPWNAKDVARLASAHPATARHVTRLVFRWLVSEVDTPADKDLGPLVDALGPKGDLGKLVETVLRSNAFFSERSYRRRVKSPVEYVVGLIRSFGGLVPTRSLGEALGGLGQHLGGPPTTSGWEGGTAWLNPATILGRSNLVVSLLDPNGPFGGKMIPPDAIPEATRAKPGVLAGMLIDLMLPGDVPALVRDQLTRAAGELKGTPDERTRRSVLMLAGQPEYHLS